MKRCILSIISLSALLFQVGCGGEAAADQITGTWYLAGSSNPAFSTGAGPPGCPQATQSRNQITIIPSEGGTQTADIISLDGSQLTLGFENAGILVFWNTQK